MSAPSLYSRILGPAFERLPSALQTIHDARRAKRYVGRCDIRGGGLIARTLARVAGLPTAQIDVPVEVTVNVSDTGEHWIRKFGTQLMQSRLTCRSQRMEERLGPLVLSFSLAAEQERIVWSLYSARLALSPVPVTWLLECEATESLDEDRYGFDVSAGLRGIGLLVHYKGWLVEHDGPSMDRVLVFDGVCVLCSHWVSFVLEHDRQRLYRFAAMQTATGRELLTRHGLDPDDPKSFLLLENGRGYMDTDALVRVLESFGGRWRLAAALIQVMPRVLRDAFYRVIARNRYRLFGRHDVCIVPSAQTADRFLS